MAKDASSNNRPTPPRQGEETEPPASAQPRQGEEINISANFVGAGGGSPPNARRGHFVLYDDDDPSARIALVVKILDELKSGGILLDAIPVERQLELVRRRAQELAPGATVSETTLRDAKRRRRSQ
jgi:hypothetical protein